MTTDNAAKQVKIGMLGMLAFIGFLGVSLTVFTNWVGLTPYPIPVLLSVFAVASLVQRRQVDHLSWKQWAVVWCGAALLSIATLGTLLTEAPTSEQVVSNVAEKASAPKSPNPEPSSMDGGEEEPKVPIVTNIDELIDAYAANQVAAAKKYGNSPIQLRGKVIRVREVLGTGILVLRSSKSGREHEFGFSNDGTTLLAGVKQGDTVIITCPGVAEGMGIVVVGGCYDLDSD